MSIRQPAFVDGAEPAPYKGVDEVDEAIFYVGAAVFPSCRFDHEAIPLLAIGRIPILLRQHLKLLSTGYSKFVISARTNYPDHQDRVSSPVPVHAANAIRDRRCHPTPLQSGGWQCRGT